MLISSQIRRMELLLIASSSHSVGAQESWAMVCYEGADLQGAVQVTVN